MSRRYKGKAALTDLVAAVRAEAAESPYGFRYHYDINTDRCIYAPDDRNPKGCIVGAAMRRSGRKLKLQRPDESVGVLLLISRTFGIQAKCSPEAEWLARVQAAQDQGHTWRDAVAFADRVVRRL